MRKLAAAGIVSVCIVSVLISCDNLTTDMPATDTAQYYEAVNTIKFKAGTKAVDVYNTVSSIINPSDDWQDVTGSWKRIKTVTNADKSGITQSWESVPFTKIRHTHSTKAPDVHTHTVYLLNANSTTREIVFQWQRQTTNIWKNDPIEGDITFTF